MKNNQRLFGLIGFPLSHSFSARYFNEKFQREKLDGRYDLFEMASIKGIREVFRKQTHLCGLNVTIPYKKDVIEYLDEIDAVAARIGAVNVIRITENKWKGFNTDWMALRDDIRPFTAGRSTALILGSGGASKAVEYALKDLNIKTIIVSRNKSQGLISYSDLDKTMLDSCDIVVNTTPLGSFPHVDTYPDIPYHLLKEGTLLYDLVYNPAESVFLKKGREKKCIIRNGYDMLVKQAELSWQIWNQ